ncbi:MAG: hypothetical protein H6757_06590 [Candidatus Omnitrophica bacterium]|nr:hypothetical protein [Candidatus Omnitrophota bacterium]
MDRGYSKNSQTTKSVLKPLVLFFTIMVLFSTGCATIDGLSKLDTPPEFNQKIMLRVDNTPQNFQAVRSGYDPGDLQAFHTLHTLPIVIEGAFQDMFGQVVMAPSGPGISMSEPDVPAIFEVKILDMTHDIYNEATSYRSDVVLGVAMKSPRDDVIFWQKQFRGEGYVTINPQFDIAQDGPRQAVLDAMRDAIVQMQNAIIASPQVRTQLQHYMEVNAARKGTEQKV